MSAFPFVIAPSSGAAGEQSMLALRKVAAAPGIALVGTARPRPAAGEVLLRMEAAGICGTDIHIAEWTPGYESMASCLPVTLGHEAAGIVIEGPDAWLGRRAVLRPSVLCGRCEACLSGRSGSCRARRGIGIHRSGAFASEIVVPEANLVAVPEDIDAELAALTEPLTVSHEAARNAAIEPGDRVLVVGPGPIGLAAAHFARKAGARRVVVAGRRDEPRLACARAMGFADCLDTADAGLTRSLADAGLPAEHDAVIEATGVAALVPELISLLAPFGRLVIAGIHAAPAQVDLTALVRRHQRIVGSYRAPLSAWPEVLAALADDGEVLRRLVSHRLPLSRIGEGFMAMASRQAVKVMVTPDG